MNRSLPGRAQGHDPMFREGLLIERSGQWAEASPLPGFSQESLQDVIAELRQGQERSPSTRFAVDSLIRPISSLSVPINALLDHRDAETEAMRISQTAISAVKLKVGRRELSQDVALVRSIRRHLRDDQQLRLDANRAWTFQQACDFGKLVQDLAIEYVEEPLDVPERLEEFSSVTNLPYALDESLGENLDRQQFPNVSALVFKPTLLGGRGRVVELVRWNKPIVFSAAFESGVGIMRVAQLAAEFSPQIAAGLDTYSWLDDDVLANRWPIVDGRLEIGGRWQVQRDRLTELDL